MWTERALRGKALTYLTLSSPDHISFSFFCTQLKHIPISILSKILERLLEIVEKEGYGGVARAVKVLRNKKMKIASQI